MQSNILTDIMLETLIYQGKLTMQSFQGIKTRMAIEFTGWSGSQKGFLDAYRGQEKNKTQRAYLASDIRQIRLGLLGVPIHAPRERKLPPIMNFRMAKGGTGKTTIAGNVGACMSSFGLKVLMIDGDPQSSLSGSFGVDWTDQEFTHIGELMRRANHKPALPTGISESIVPIYDGGMLDLIPSDITMTGTDSWMTQIQLGRELAFTRLLEKELDFFSQYDVIVIDSAPSTSMLTTSFMVASQTMLAVIMPEAQSRKALDILVSNVQELNETFPDKGYGFHVVINRYNQAKKPHQDEMALLVDKYQPYINDVVVRDFVGFLRETNGKGEPSIGPVLEREPNSVGARDIIDLTKNLIKMYGIKLAENAARTA